MATLFGRIGHCKSIRTIDSDSFAVSILFKLISGFLESSTQGKKPAQVMNRILKAFSERVYIEKY